MNELFVRFFLTELRKAGFYNASYDKEHQRVVISPEYTRLFVAYEDREYLVHYNVDSSAVMPVIKDIKNAAVMLTSAWERAAPDEAVGATNFRKLLEWNDIVLAARDDGDRGLYFATWQYDNDRKGVSDGHYTGDIFGAMRDFAGRSGLIPMDRIFNDEQLDLFRSALAYKLENDGEIYPNEEQKIKSLLSVLEP